MTSTDEMGHPPDFDAADFGVAELNAGDRATANQEDLADSGPAVAEETPGFSGAPLDGPGLEVVDLGAAVEAILMVAAEGVTAASLAEATSMPESATEEVLRRLQAEYDGSDQRPARGFELRETEGVWRIYSRARWAPWVGRFVASGQNSSLSRAAMETLAVIAYRQPVTRAQIGRIRGVNVDSVLRTLLARDLIAEDGSSPTGAHLLRTTTTFLEYMGLSSLDDLEPLAPFMPEPEGAGALIAELP